MQVGGDRKTIFPFLPWLKRYFIIFRDKEIGNIYIYKAIQQVAFTHKLPHPSTTSRTHTHTLKSINKRQKKRADLGQQTLSTCRRALFPPSLLGGGGKKRKHASTLAVTKPQKPLKSAASMSGHWLYYCSICLITAACTPSQQNQPYYHGTHLVTAAPATAFASVIIFYCRQHPYYLSIILVNAA